LEGNPIESPEFDIYDLLPGLANPGVFAHVYIEEFDK
jgi:hypothetical protein